jgi:hypothetical protein
MSTLPESASDRLAWVAPQAVVVARSAAANSGNQLGGPEGQLTQFCSTYYTVS